MSRLSRFKEDAPIRGGIPVIFPWFGPAKARLPTASPAFNSGNCAKFPN